MKPLKPCPYCGAGSHRHGTVKRHLLDVNDGHSILMRAETQRYLCPECRRTFLEYGAVPIRTMVTPRLQREIRKLARGKSDQAVADELDISRTTVRKYR